MPEEFDKERQQLLDRFKESLRGIADDYFFDEDDLIEIFDYAGDLNNDYLRAEALMRAARFYPDSEPMRQRRITFYADVLDPAMTEGMVEDSSDDGSLLTQIALLRNSSVGKEEIRRRMEEFLVKYPPFDDEETIRFVALGNDFMLLNWMYEIFPKIAEHVVNEDVLLYEMGFDFYDTFSLERNFDKASELLGRLVEKMPFVADYWQILARSQYYSTKYRNKYEESLELALALNPEHRESLLFRAEIIENEQSADKNKDKLAEICDLYPAEEQPLKLLLSTMDEKIMSAEGVKRLQTFLEAHPDSYFAISELLAIDPEKAEPFLDKFESASRLSSSIGHVWAMVLYMLVDRQPSAIPVIIGHVLSGYKTRNEVVEDNFYVAAIECTFYLQNFELMLSLVNSYCTIYESNSTIILLLAIAQAKTGNISEARSYAQLYLRMNFKAMTETDGWHLVSRMVNIGARQLMYDLINRTQPGSVPPFNPKAYNPYGLFSPEPPESDPSEIFLDSQEDF